MKSWKHFPHLAGLRSWWLWGSAPSAFDLWEVTEGAGAMADTVQPQDWITWAFAVARDNLEISSWIYPSAIPRWTKWGAPSQIAFCLRSSVCVYFTCCSAWPSPDYGACKQRAAALPQPKTTAASWEMPWSLTDTTCTKPCMGVLQMLVWVSRSEGRLQNVWLKMRGDFCPGAMEGWVQMGAHQEGFSEYKHCSQLGSGGGTMYC